jgi:glycosyltransferase involved in cell wall biosynthesis
VARPKLLVDATPLRSHSGLRGIGRFVRDLLHGLSETQRDWEHALCIEAIATLEASGGYRVSSDLAAVAEEAFAARGTGGSWLMRARRTTSGRVAQDSKCAAIHFTEALGLPADLRIPRVVTCYDLIPLRMPWQYGQSFGRSFFFRRRCLRDYGGAERVVAISEKTGREIEELLGLPRSKIDVVPLGLSLTRQRTAQPEDATMLEAVGVVRPYVLYVGYSDYRKNVEGMMAALAEARRTIDADLVWAGALPPSEQARVMRLARRAGVAEHVKLLGFVNDDRLDALYRRAVAHIFISRLEGFGFTVTEAMAAGCPVIVGEGSGSDEIAGSAAIRVNPEDFAAAGRHIVSLAKDPGLATKLASAGVERVKLFDRRRMARDYVTSYARALGITELAQPSSNGATSKPWPTEAGC